MRSKNTCYVCVTIAINDVCGAEFVNFLCDNLLIAFTVQLKN